jgi:RNA 2',3'-cyclic 3'-phosphodiesterase
MWLVSHKNCYLRRMLNDVMMRRLFVAIPVVPDRALQALLTDAAGFFAGDRIRWVKPGQMHLTLKFLGETPDFRTEELCHCFRAVAWRHGPFTCRLEGTGIFGSRYAPRVIWVGTGGDAPLRALGEDVLDAAATIGFPRERLPFVPHLTLGRIADIRNKNRLSQWITDYRNSPFGDLPVTGVTLYESTLHTTGAQHHIIETFPLHQ